jgi:hypothetical protein
LPIWLSNNQSAFTPSRNISKFKIGIYSFNYFKIFTFFVWNVVSLEGVFHLLRDCIVCFVWEWDYSLFCKHIDYCLLIKSAQILKWFSGSHVALYVLRSKKSRSDLMAMDFFVVISRISFPKLCIISKSRVEFFKGRI